MITESELYWILKLDDIRNLLTGCTIVLGFTSVVLIIMTVAQAVDEYFICASNWRRSKVARLSVYAALIVVVTALTLLPSTKQMAAIKALPAIVNSEAAKDISSDAKELYKLGVDTLKEKLKDTHSNKEQ